MSVNNRKKYLSDLLTGQLLNISISFKKKMELLQFISAGHLTRDLHKVSFSLYVNEIVYLTVNKKGRLY